MKLHRLVFAATLTQGLLLVAVVAHAQDAGAAAVCERWTCDRINLAEGTSTADIATCDAGTWLEPGPANSLRLVNLYRFVAAMPAVSEDPSYDAFAQDCALLQAANSASGLSHTPDAGATCYSASAATGSAHSSICSGEGVACIDLYMQDMGSAELGHRRWILANYLGPVGFGSVGTGRSNTGSCFYQPAGSMNARMPYVAWPPPGNVPLEAITTTLADTAGWSIQSDSINLSSATVTVTDGAMTLPVTVTALPQNFGSTYAIRIVPNEWTSTAGHQYAVSVGGITSTIAYQVNVIDCTAIDAGSCPPEDGGASGGDGAAPPSGSSGGGSSVDATVASTSGLDGGGSSASGSSAGSSGGGSTSPPNAATAGTPGAGASHSGCSCNVPGPPVVPLHLGLSSALVVAGGLAARRRMGSRSDRRRNARDRRTDARA